MAAIVLAVLSDNEPPASLRKPLNPVLGETATHSVVFEATGERFVSVWEQVSHHPPVSAHCTEGANVRVEGQLLLVHTSSARTSRWNWWARRASPSSTPKTKSTSTICPHLNGDSSRDGKRE